MPAPSPPRGPPPACSASPESTRVTPVVRSIIVCDRHTGRNRHDEGTRAEPGRSLRALGIASAVSPPRPRPRPMPLLRRFDDPTWMPNRLFNRSRRAATGSVAQIDSAAQTCPARRPPMMASAICPPPMNAIFFVITGLVMPRYRKSRCPLAPYVAPSSTATT